MNSELGPHTTLDLRCKRPRLPVRTTSCAASPEGHQQRRRRPGPPPPLPPRLFCGTEQTARTVSRGLSASARPDVPAERSAAQSGKIGLARLLTPHFTCVQRARHARRLIHITGHSFPRGQRAGPQEMMTSPARDAASLPRRSPFPPRPRRCRPPRLISS
jgi:hypothetical protein